ncbi:hypothetical protein J4E93_006628 [Alternaria ventricosa]|uniref:uncharacterized protein n=1 Tax=Alternaria ventricosa TaxID=1187951 RepID=UPI0020C5670C|nr:uncharacterized protein J4E93_006628 [Alternaria ventricosa]KAI4643617.1 hypothetical protein J4E93_006628 [Alternaria ventricosa]
MGPAMNDATDGLEADNAHDGFKELLTAINPYVDELLHQPAFHLFMTLPAELRCMVYEQYFLDETHSIACQNWPHLRFSKDYEWSIRVKRKHSPFLPPLCLTTTNGHATVSVRALSFEMFLHDFQLQAILGLEELQKLSIIKISGVADIYDILGQIKVNDSGLVEDLKSSNLTAILHLCRQIKTGFTMQGRNVVVKAYLQYGQEVYEERIFE